MNVHSTKKPRRKRGSMSGTICDDLLLNEALKPIWKYVGPKRTTEVFVNQPHKVIVDTRGDGKREVSDRALTVGYFKTLMAHLANFHGLKFDESRPILSTTLPQKHRFQGAVGKSPLLGVSIAIRCKHPFDATYQHFGLEGEPLGYLRSAMKQELNMVISGSTNTGKTTLFNLLLKEADTDRRIMTVEDTEELVTDHFFDRSPFLAGRDEESGAEGMLTYRQIYDHFVRASPELVCFGEISTTNAFAALGLLNTGHKGFVCTIHADRPEQVIERKFSQNVAWAGRERMDNIPEYLRDMVDVVIQIRRARNGMRVVTDIWEPKTNRVVFKREGEFAH